MTISKTFYTPLFLRFLLLSSGIFLSINTLLANCPCTPPPGYTSIYCEDFESGTSFQELSDFDGDKWSVRCAGNEEAQIFNGTVNTFALFNPGSPALNSTLSLGNRTSGQYAIEWEIDGSGYSLELLHTSVPSNCAQRNRNAQIWFFDDNTGTVRLGTSSGQYFKEDFIYSSSNINQMQLLIDIEADLVKLKINDVLKAEWEFSYGSQANSNVLGYLTFGIMNTQAEYAIDNICFSQKQSTDNPTETCSDCSSCFHYLDQGDNSFRFEGNYCAEETGIKHRWNFPEQAINEVTQGQLIDQSFTARLNPGTWEVCYVVYSGDIERYSCCIRIFVPTTCTKDPPIPHYTIQNTPMGYRFDAGSSINADSYHWSVEDENGQSIGNLNPVISNGGRVFSFDALTTVQRCWWVNLTVSNCAGMCTYRIPVNCPDCQPPTIPTPPIYDLTDNTARFSGFQSSWGNYTWSIPSGASFVNESNAQSRNPSIQFPSHGVYWICLVISNECGHNVCICYTIRVGNPPPGDVVIIDCDDICGIRNETVCVPIRARNFQNIGGAQMTFKLRDATVAQFVENEPVGDIALPNAGNAFYRASPTVLTMAWFNTQPVTIPQNDILFCIKIRILGEVEESTDLFIEGTPTPILISDDDFMELSYNVLPGKICVEEDKARIAGNIRTVDNAPVAQVTVTLSEDKSDTYLTESDGYYEFDNLVPGDFYTVTPTKNLNLNNGLNVQDARAIQLHVGGSRPFTQAQEYIAADTKRDASIDVRDALLIQEVVLGIKNSFDNNASWKFIPKTDYDQLTTVNALTYDSYLEEIQYRPLNGDRINEDFIGIKIGDVDRSANPQQLLGHPENQAQPNPVSPQTLKEKSSYSSAAVHLQLGNWTGAIADTAIVQLTAKEFNQMAAMQFSLNWESELLSLVSVDLMTDELPGLEESIFLDSLSVGKLTCVWFSTNAIDLAPETPILRLKFRTLALSDSTEVRFSNSPTPILFIGGDNEVTPHHLDNAKVVITSINGVPHPVQMGLELQVYPNPVQYELNVNLAFEQPTDYELTLFGTAGNIVQSRSGKKVLEQLEKISCRRLSSGIYYLRIRTSDGTYTQKVMITSL